MPTRVKICGITRLEDAKAAVGAGADAIGLVFDRRSARCVEIAQAQAIARELPPFVALVGLFVDATAERVAEVLRDVPLTLLQFHGDEAPEQCRRYGRPYIKAIRMRDGVNLKDAAARYADASGLLLDSFVADQAGGSGTTFDWGRIPRDLARPIVLAGGLTVDNVRDAIRRVQPAAVDVSSGVEVSKGIKDPQKIAAFIAAVREVS